NPFTPDFLGTNGNPSADDKVTDGPFAFDGPHHWTIQVLDAPGSPPYLQRRFGNTQQQPIALPTGAMVADALTGPNSTHYELPPYHGDIQINDSSFRSQSEYTLHNPVHSWVGGTMSRMTSPNDPVFFLHHCNIDRLWWMWQT